VGVFTNRGDPPLPVKTPATFRTIMKPGKTFYTASQAAAYQKQVH
jgi:hypothetical protein